MAETASGQATYVEMTIFPWWAVLLQGLLAIILGIVFLAYPQRTVGVVVWLFGIYLLFVGIVSLVSIFVDRSNLAWKLIFGILGIIAGGYLIAHPTQGAVVVPTAIALIIGILALVMGAMMLLAAFRGGGWGAGILGVLVVILGLLIIGSPYIAAATLLYLLAFFTLAGGIILVIVAFRVRKATQ
ncbi:MAG: DUF308 domain-containing protein [Methanotrichaceae archaeon]|nr:DUF308 domain-containing protein [Methanotrichaceae archaeon]